MYFLFLQTTSAEEDASNQWLHDYLQCCYRVCIGHLSDALCCFLLPDAINMAAIQYILYWTFLVWVIVTAIFTLVNYNRMLNSRLEEMIKKTTDEQEDILITLHDQNLRGTDLTLPINNLLYIEARKNNVCVCYIKEGRLQKTELRSTLTALKDDLPYDNVFQCHRSFLVNVNNIVSAKGNSNGYQLLLTGCEDIIPVSRTFVPGLRHFVG